VLAAALLMSAVVVILNRNYFADMVVGNCNTDHPYYIETGNNNVPADFLISIPSAESLKWIGEVPNSEYSVCSSSGRLATHIDKSGRIWFRPGEEIPANSKATFYIEKGKELINNELFSPGELKDYTFNSVPTQEQNSDGWQIVQNNQNIKYTKEIIQEDNPGDNKTFKINITDDADEANRELDIGKNPDLELTSDWLPITQRHTNVASGWIKTENLEFDSNSDGTSKSGNHRILVSLDVRHKFETPRDTNSDGITEEYLYTRSDFYSIANPDDIGWDEMTSSYVDYSGSSVVNNKSTDNETVDFTDNSVRIRVAISNIKGGISLSNFGIIKNVPVTESLKDATSSLTGSPVWAQSYFAHFGEVNNIPNKLVKIDGTPFKFSDNLKYYHTNDFATYYADHTDGEIIVDKPLLGYLEGKNLAVPTFKPISEFNSGDEAIIIGDLENQDFKTFIEQNFADAIKLGEYKKEGYTIYSKNSKLVVAGTDMAGSYYGTIRLAEILKTTDTIGPTVEIGYPDIPLRAWDYNYKANISLTADYSKADIVKASSYRFNAYMVYSSGNFAFIDKEQSNREKYLEIFAYAKKYFMEPIPQTLTYGYPYKKVLTKDSNGNFVDPVRDIPSSGTINRPYVKEKIEFYDNAGTGKNYPNSFGKLIQRKYVDDQSVSSSSDAVIPLTVKSADGTKTYAECSEYTENETGGVVCEGDYVIRVAKLVKNESTGEWESKLVSSNEDDLGIMVGVRDDYDAYYSVTRTTTSTIAADETVEITFNGLPKYIDSRTKTYDGQPFPPAAIKRASTRINSPEYRAYAKKAISNIITYLHPKYIHINNDEISSIGLDYRDLFQPDGVTRKTGNSSAEIVSRQLNDLSSYTEQQSNSETKLIAWSDILNPYHRPGMNYLGNVYPYAHSALDTISKNVILDNWNYVTQKSSCINAQRYADLVIPKGFQIIMSPSLYNVEPESNWRCWAKVANSILNGPNANQMLGWITPDWSTVRHDATEARLLSSIEWNTSGETTEVNLRDHTPPQIVELNISEGQNITSNPYVIRAKVTDDVAVDRVLFYVNDELLATTALADLEGYYETPLDTSKYLNTAINVRVVAYDTAGNSSEKTVQANISSAVSTPEQINGTPVFELPRTGSSGE
jgi:hypothetical protein